MPKFYVSFGQMHAHATPRGTCDKDCLYEIEAKTRDEAHERAFELFDAKWGMLYTEEELPSTIKYFPRGILRTLAMSE